jgi:hypothetical protein
VAYKVQLTYFRQTGKFLATAETTIAREPIDEIWKEVDSRRRLGDLPGLRPGAGRDLLVVIDVPDHPQRVLHMVMPSFVDDDDVTPTRRSTGEMLPLVRLPLDEMPRTTTRDLVKMDANTTTAEADDDVTPVDRPLPKEPDEGSR